MKIFLRDNRIWIITKNFLRCLCGRCIGSYTAQEFPGGLFSEWVNVEEKELKDYKEIGER